MMKWIVWNTHAQEVLQNLFSAYESTQSILFPFLLLVWPSHVWKTTLLESFLQDIMWAYMAQDYLPLYDCSDQLNKNHALRIDVPSKDQYIELADWRSVVNKWVREVIQWLSFAPAGRLKVVYLENIERMTISAANALLKTFEEPLPNRLLIASVWSEEVVLDTIASRACIIRFTPLDASETRAYIHWTYPNVSQHMEDFLMSFSLWRPWLIHELMEWEERDRMQEKFNHITSLLQSNESSLVDLYQALLDRKKSYALWQLLDAFLYIDEEVTTSLTDAVVLAKKRLTTNVSVDTILFEFSLHCTS